MSEAKETVKCGVCGKEMLLISYTHLKTHGMTTSEYSQMFPLLPLRIHTEEAKARMSATHKSLLTSDEYKKQTRAHLYARKGTTLSEENKAKLKAGHIKEHLTEEHKKKIGQAHKGRKFTSDHRANLSISRSLVNNSHVRVKFLSAKTGRVISCRSNWELCYYLYLEYNPEVVEYSVESFSVVYKHPNGFERRYVPDVKVIYSDNRIEVVEVKPKEFVSHPVNVAKFSAAEEFCFLRNWIFKVVTQDTFDFIGMLIRSQAAEFDDNDQRKVQRLASEAHQANKLATSAGPLSMDKVKR